MMANKKMYARISDYGDLLVPVALLEKVLSECYLVRTSYDDGNDTISEVKDLSKCRFTMHNAEELNTVIATQKLAE